MKVLVTGGAGFVGSHVVESLLGAGLEIRVLDRAGPDGADLTDPDVVAAAVRGVGAVCHQAARVGLGVDFGDVTGYVSDNGLGTACLLGALWRAGFRGRLVLASSMVVYGRGQGRCPVHGTVVPAPRQAADLERGRFDPQCPVAACGRRAEWLPIDETAPPDPQNVYAATKLHQEQLCRLWGRDAGATVVALRYHNVYGPRMPRDTPYAGVAAIFRSAVLGGRAPLVFEDGGQTRDFVHVRDVARANLLALTAAGVPSGAYNIASGEPHTVLDLATALAGSRPGSPLPAVNGRWRPGDVRHVVASPRRAAEILGFRPEISFDAGMAEFASDGAEAAAALAG